ncbi:hypothetical protein ACJMK2_024812, partial [Sinanodonta woodiana]
VKMKTKSAILILLLACMMFQISYSCSSLNQDKPCLCACENVISACRAYCSTISGIGSENVTAQLRCYKN